jgi:antitoxin FitA
MPNITIREIPDVLYQDIKKMAEEERRSINSQIIYSLSQYVKNEKSTEQRLAEIRKLRQAINVKEFHPTQEQLKEMVEEGRP